MYLGKSLMELDALADDLLKSSNSDPIEDEEQEKPADDGDLKPEDISEGASSGDDEPGDGDGEGAEPEENKGDDGEPAEEGAEAAAEGGEEPPAEENPEEDNKPAEKDKEDIKKSSSGLPEDGDAGDPAEEGNELEKSIRNQFANDPAVRQGIEASEFLSSLVDVLAKSLTDMQYDLADVNNVTTESNGIIAKSLQASLQMNAQLREENKALKSSIETLEKSFNDKLDNLSKSITDMGEKISSIDISEKMNNIMEQLDEFSKQPSHIRKSVGNINMLDRDFGASLNGTPIQQNTFESLSKAQVMEVLTNELMAKNTMVTAGDIIGYESGAPLRPDLQQLVVSKVK